jgi:hypothetical protein
MGDEKHEWERRLKGKAERAFDTAQKGGDQEKAIDRSHGRPETPQMHLRPDGPMRAAGDADGRLARAKAAHQQAIQEQEAKRTDRTSFSKADLDNFQGGFDKNIDDNRQK